MSDITRQQAVAGDSALIVVVLDQANAYQTQLLDGIRSALDSAPCSLIVYVNDPAAHAIRSPGRRLLRSGRTAGVITTMLSNPESQQDLNAILANCLEVPVVHVGSPLANGSSVGTDNAAGMALVMAHLLDDLGARRVAVVRGPDHHSDSTAREAAVRAELAARGLTLAGALDGEFDRDAAYTATAKFLTDAEPFDAVVAFNDRSAAGALDALNDRDVPVPGDVLVTGFDDDEIAIECVPPLTTIDQQLYHQGALAAQLLLERMSGAAPHGHLVVKPELVVRGSTDEGFVVPERIPEPAHTTTAVLNRARSISRAFMGCRTVDDVLRELSASMPKLDLRRCLVVLHTAPQGADAPAFGTLVFRYIDRQTELTPKAMPFDLRGAPPPELIDAVSRGTLILQPLNVGTEDLGYVMFEQETSDAFVGEMLRMDLGRAIDTVRRIENHTDVLEGLVSVRTQELREQIAARERAEDKLRRANLELSRLSKSDGLTMIANRAAFDDYLQEQWDAAANGDDQLSLLFIDVDHFKQINDTYGHVFGDQCLRVAARCLQEATWSPGDLAARFGGDEFAAILPATDSAGAAAVAARFTKTVDAATVTDPTGAPVRFTVSIGVATLRPSRSLSPTQLIAKADAALYEAKTGGRNQVVSA